MRPTPPALARNLVAWYDRNRRDLPWRRTRDPWAIWISEVMLQQTRVAVVEQAWPRFLARFPDPASLARADDEALLGAWSGLGYYRRARLLRDAARLVVDEHGGRVPSDPDALAALPGIGTYTLGAVSSIAFDTPRPTIDGNVERVAARMLALDDSPKLGPGRARVADFYASLVPHAEAAVLPQALMELGALVCTPRAPRCGTCPWSGACAAHATGTPEAWPVGRPEQRAVETETALLLARRGERVLALRRGDGEYNAGQWCLPGLGLPGLEHDERDSREPLSWRLAEALAEVHGLATDGLRELGSFRHAITRYRIRARVFGLEPAPARAGRGLRWIDPGDEAFPTSTALRKALRLVTTEKGRASGATPGKRSRS